MPWVVAIGALTWITGCESVESAAEHATELVCTGISCIMNVGNANFLSSLARAYVYKVESCEVLEERLALLGDTRCDSVALLELLGDEQCRCACDHPDKDQVLCEDSGWVPDDARCSLCSGCGRAAPSNDPSCVNQAAVVCDPEHYDLSCSTSADPVGCDCLCRRKPDECGLRNDEPVEVMQPPAGCDLGSQAICASRSDPATGAVIDATCLVHPSHCTGVLGTDEGCIADCHTPLLSQAFAFVSAWPDARATLVGDWNCGAAGECNYPGADYCMWEADLPSYGLEKCPFGQTPTAQPNWLGGTPCILDFAVGNRCSVWDQCVVAGRRGDLELGISGEPCDP